MKPSRSREVQFEPPYDAMFRGVLLFRTLAETEETIDRLEELRQRFLAASDKKGVEYCLRVGAAGRMRAEMIARNRRVHPLKRRQKQEEALWFGVWLDTPELFDDWRSLRKVTGDFRKMLESESEP